MFMWKLLALDICCHCWIRESWKNLWYIVTWWDHPKPSIWKDEISIHSNYRRISQISSWKARLTGSLLSTVSLIHILQELQKENLLQIHVYSNIFALFIELTDLAESEDLIILTNIWATSLSNTRTLSQSMSTVLPSGKANC